MHQAARTASPDATLVWPAMVKRFLHRAKRRLGRILLPINQSSDATHTGEVDRRIGGQSKIETAFFLGASGCRDGALLTRAEGNPFRESGRDAFHRVRNVRHKESDAVASLCSGSRSQSMRKAVGDFPRPLRSRRGKEAEIIPSKRVQKGLGTDVSRLKDSTSCPYKATTPRRCVVALQNLAGILRHPTNAPASWTAVTEQRAVTALALPLAFWFANKSQMHEGRYGAAPWFSLGVSQQKDTKETKA